MKNILLLLTLTLTLLALSPLTANAVAIYYKVPCYGTSGVWGCPNERFYTRDGKRVVAAYQPSFPNYFNQSMDVWRIANGPGISQQDWQDINSARSKIGSRQRWGMCFSSQTSWCLY